MRAFAPCRAQPAGSMRTDMRGILPLALAALVVLTAQTFAVARGQAAVAGEIVMCSGGVAVTVTVDAEGKPTGPAHVCPDCVMNALAALPASGALAGFERTLLALAFVDVPVLPASADAVVPRARDPPRAV